MVPGTHSPQADRLTARLAVWLGCIVMLLTGLSRQLVLCTGDDGVAHIEFVHDEGDCCFTTTDRAAQWLRSSESRGEPGLSADPTCSHVDFAIDVAPPPSPELSSTLPTPAGGALAVARPPLVENRRNAFRPPPATGPPRARSFLAQRATTLLLI